MTYPTDAEQQFAFAHPNAPRAKAIRARMRAHSTAQVRDRTAARIIELEKAVAATKPSEADLQIYGAAIVNRAGVGLVRTRRLSRDDPDAALVAR